MGRYTGPACRQCRREGMKLFLKGARCYMAKCPIDQGHPAPGMHGMRRSRKASEYGQQLREKQRLRRQYGMQEGQFHRVFEEALRRPGVTGETMLQMVEMRLDNRELMEIYDTYSPKGLEVFQVAIDTDKTAWALAVREQSLPWVSVCDGLGGYSPALVTYNVGELPAYFIINSDEEILARTASLDEVARIVKSLL